MSHLSKIKTRINNKEILQKTLNEMGFNYECKQANNLNLIVKDNEKNIFEFVWDGQEYSLIADLQLWKCSMPAEILIEKITQKYSYNSIIKESIGQGFVNVSEEIMQDGSIRLVIQRWN